MGKLESSLAKLGDISGIVHNLETDEIIGGNQRCAVIGNKADIKIIEQYDTPDKQGTVAHGYILWRGTKLAYRQVRWNEAQAAEANIAANLGAGQWDSDIFANQWESEELKPHFDDDRVKEWGQDLGWLKEFVESNKPTIDEAPEPEIDRAVELREKWGVAYGDLWRIGEHRLLCGDSTNADDVARLMAGEKSQACVTDPPYGIDFDTDYTRFSSSFAKQVNYARIKNDDKEFDPRPFLDYEAVVLFGANWYCKHIPLGSWIVWDKRHDNGAAFLSDAEIAWMKGGKGVHIYSETVQGAIRKERAMHPTQKPVGLFMWCIEKCKAGSMVFDPFSGSGTTLVACQNLNRRGRAIEISPGYVAVALERLSQMGLQPEKVTA